MDFTAWFGAFMGAFGFLLGAMFMWLWDRTGNVPDSTAGAAYDACEDERVTDHDARAFDLLKKNGLLT